MIALFTQVSGEPGPGQRAAIYLRVSSQKQVEKDIDPEGLSLPSQRKHCEGEAQKQGAEVAREYIEPGVSGGSLLKRKAFKRLLADIEELKDIEVVIVWNVSRWARDERDLWVAYGILQKHGVELASASEPIDSSPTGMLVFGIMGTIAAHQRRQLSLDVKRTQKQKAEVGGTPGLAPIGYRNTTVEIDGHSVRDVKRDKERAPLVREAFDLYASGDYSLSELAAILEDRGLRFRATRRLPERPIGVNRLAEILRNPYYLGQVRHDGKVYAGRHKPLVDEATFQTVQDLLTAKRQSGERSWRNHHHLRGSLFCRQCKRRLFYVRPKGNGGTYEYFVCEGGRQGKCPEGHHRAAAVEAAIERHYGSDEVIQLAETWRDRIREAVGAHIGAIAKEANKEIAEAKVEQARLTGQERKLLQAHYADQVSPGLFADEQARIRREQAAAKRRLRELSIDHERVLEALDAALTMTTDIQTAYIQAGPQERRLLNQAFFKGLDISEEEIVGYELAEPFASLQGLKRAMQAKDAGLDHLGTGWKKSPPRPRQPVAGRCEAGSAITPGPSSRAEGYHVETLVRLRGVEPPRTFLHTDLKRARLPVPPQPRGQAIYRSAATARPATTSRYTRVPAPLSSRGLGRRILSPETGVRIPVAVWQMQSQMRPFRGALLRQGGNESGNTRRAWRS